MAGFRERQEDGLDWAHTRIMTEEMGERDNGATAFCFEQLVDDVTYTGKGEAGRKAGGTKSSCLFSGPVRLDKVLRHSINKDMLNDNFHT